MRISRIEIAQFPVPFRRAVSHAAATREAAENVIVCARSETGATGFGEGCPRHYVTGETTESARGFIASIARDAAKHARDPETLKRWIDANKATIDRNPAAFTALELALLDAKARERGVSIEGLLDLPPLSASYHRYAAVLGDSPPAASWALWLRYRLAGFYDFKVKASRDTTRDRAKLRPFRIVAGQRLRLDANNLWRTPQDCIDHLSTLGTSVFAIEEPLAPHDVAGCSEVARRTGLAIILDESFLAPAFLDSLPSDVDWIVNVRISKLGGLLRTLDAVRVARQRGLKIVVGSHVGETGLLSRAALPVARASGDALVSQEGAFGTHLLTHDLVDPSPRFGARGRIPRARLPSAQSPGLGLSVNSAMLIDVESLAVGTQG